MTPDQLLELERLDTEAAQLRYRRDHLDERDRHAAAAAALAAWESKRARLAETVGTLDAEIVDAEAQAAEVAAHKTRLEAQLKTVIAPREAEALMNEIATLDERRDALDLAELEAMERQTDTEAELAAHAAGEAAVRAELDRCTAALAAATATIDDELAGSAPRIAELRAQLTDGERSRYDRLREQLGGAVAQLEGRQCTGCYLDLSAAEADDARDAAAATGITDCPNCGRMLIIT